MRLQINNDTILQFDSNIFLEVGVDDKYDCDCLYISEQVSTPRGIEAHCLGLVRDEIEALKALKEDITQNMLEKGYHAITSANYELF